MLSVVAVFVGRRFSVAVCWLAFSTSPARAGAQSAPIAPRPDAPAAPPAPPTPPADPDPGDGPPDVPHLALGAGGHVAFGLAPAVAVGVRLSAEVATGRWSLGLEGRYDLLASGHTTPGATARTALAGVGLVPCARSRATWACGVVLLSRVGAEASELGGTSVSDSFFFLGIGGRLALHAALPWDFALRVGGEVLAHPIPYELVQNGHRVYKSSAVSTTIGPAIVRAF